MNRVFILGAGASAHAGAPLGNNIIKKYIELKLEKLEKEKNVIGGSPVLGNSSTLSHILFTQPNCKFTHLTPLDSLREENLPNIEDVFTLYDIAYQKDEALFYEADIDVNIIRKDILELLTYTIVHSTWGAMNQNGTTNTYQEFVDNLSIEDTIISYNYDTLLDNAIFNKFKMLNYGFDFLTIEDTIVPRPEKERQVLIRSIAEDEGISSDEVVKKYFVQRDPKINFGEDVPLLLKPHGSLNWLYCPKCYRFYCLSHKEFFERYAFYPSECMNYCGGNLQQFIVPLTHHKNYQNPILNNMWMRVTQQLSTAEEVFFIGYSMPDADYSSKYYFIKGLTRPNRRNCAKLILISPNANDSGLSNKFISIFGDISEIIDHHEYEEVELPIGKQPIKVKQIKEEKYKYGEKKFKVIEKKFEDWIKLIKL
ncbi:MAG: hypothetical protein ACFFDN_01055 [Candidatus Hodarchaeota archaeon]